MRGVISPLLNTPSWSGGSVKAQGQLYLLPLFRDGIVKTGIRHCHPHLSLMTPAFDKFHQRFLPGLLICHKNVSTQPNMACFVTCGTGVGGGGFKVV
jgi:hypothetical protein